MSFANHPRADTLVAEIVPLNAVPEAWDAQWGELAQRAAEPNAFAESWFVRASIAHLPLPTDARMLSVWQGPMLLGLLPLCVAPRYGRLPIRHVSNWLHYHAFLGTPLVRRGSEAAFWATMLGALDAAPWAPAFLHVNGLTSDGAVLAALRATRRADIVHRTSRAMLASDLSPAAYYETHVRKKKRKEIGRLQSRLREQGGVAFEKLGAADDVSDWIDAFLNLEASGWKGRAGTALRDDPATRAFFTATVTGALAASKLEFLRLTLDGVPIAMLVNFLNPPGSFSFKIAFDEAYARYSPGVLIQLDNLNILDRAEIAWMDSCAVEDHSMINSLWAERREIVRVTVPLAGIGRRAAFEACRALENTSAFVRRLKA